MSKKQQEILHRKTGRNYRNRIKERISRLSLYTEHERKFVMLSQRKSSDLLKSWKKTTTTTPERPTDKDCLEIIEKKDLIRKNPTKN